MNAGIVYAREIGGREYTFGVSGKLWRDALVMYDRQSESLWSQVDGRAFRGPRKGEILEHIPSVQTTWGKWKKLHPETLVLKKESEFTSTRYEKYFTDPDRIGVFGNPLKDERLGGKVEIVGVRAGGKQMVFPLEALRAAGLVNSRVGETEILLHADPQTAAVHAFSRMTSRGVLNFSKIAKKKRKGWIRDRETGTLWDPRTGQAVKGKMRGTQLDEISATKVFWFAWAAFFPGSEIWTPETESAEEGSPATSS